VMIWAARLCLALHLSMYLLLDIHLVLAHLYSLLTLHPYVYLLLRIHLELAPYVLMQGSSCSLIPR